MANGVRYSSTRLLPASATYRLPDAVDGHVCRIAEAVRAESVGITDRDAVVAIDGERVGLPDDDIGGLVVGEPGGVGPSEHAIVD